MELTNIGISERTLTSKTGRVKNRLCLLLLYIFFLYTGYESWCTVQTSILLSGSWSFQSTERGFLKVVPPNAVEIFIWLVCCWDTYFRNSVCNMWKRQRKWKKYNKCITVPSSIVQLKFLTQTWIILYSMTLVLSQSEFIKSCSMFTC